MPVYVSLAAWVGCLCVHVSILLCDPVCVRGGAAEKKENLLLAHGHIVHKGRKEWVMLESPLIATRGPKQ